MSDPITPTGKRLTERHGTCVCDYEQAGQPCEYKVLLAQVEREAREPTDDGAWFTVDSLAAALERLCDGDHPLVRTEATYHAVEAAAIIRAAKEVEPAVCDNCGEPESEHRKDHPLLPAACPAAKEAERAD